MLDKLFSVLTLRLVVICHFYFYASNLLMFT